MLHFLSYPAFEILALAILFAAGGLWSFRKAAKSISARNIILIGVIAIVLTTTSLMIQSSRVGGMTLTRYFGWPHEYASQASKGEFLANFEGGAKINFNATYAVINLIFYAALAYYLNGLMYLWKTKRTTAAILLLVLIIIFYGSNAWVQQQDNRLHTLPPGMHPSSPIQP